MRRVIYSLCTLQSTLFDVFGSCPIPPISDACAGRFSSSPLQRMCRMAHVNAPPAQLLPLNARIQSTCTYLSSFTTQTCTTHASFWLTESHLRVPTRASMYKSPSGAHKLYSSRPPRLHPCLISKWQPPPPPLLFLSSPSSSPPSYSVIPTLHPWERRLVPVPFHLSSAKSFLKPSSFTKMTRHALPRTSTPTGLSFTPPNASLNLAAPEIYQHESER